MSELQHHGVLGMHWGIRRYQPYGEGGYNPKKKGKEVGEAAKNSDILAKVKKAAGVGVGVGSAVAVGAAAASKAHPEARYEYNRAMNHLDPKESSGMTAKEAGALKGAANQASNALRKTSEALRKDSNSYTRLDLRDKSNKELQDAITRENLEVQYSKIFGKDETKRGHETVAKYLDLSADVVQIGVGALTAAVLIKSLKG